jgi:hypothetical protein
MQRHISFNRYWTRGMEISPEERTEHHPRNSRANDNRSANSTSGKLILLLITIAILGGLGYYLFTPSQPVETDIETVSLASPELSHTPTPSASAPASEPETDKQIPQRTEQPVPAFKLPSLDESDSEAEQQLNQLTPAGNFSQWFYPEHIIRRGITFIDGLSRGIQLNKMHKAPVPKKPFMAIREGNQFWLNPNNYQRYDYFIKVVNAIDSDQLVTSFHLFRPLLEQAYGELGYSPQALDKAIVSALDQIVAAPVREEPVALTRESVQYKYADPELEALPPIQKQLLRMGPENTRIIQQKAMQLRDALLKS